MQHHFEQQGTWTYAVRGIAGKKQEQLDTPGLHLDKLYKLSPQLLIVSHTVIDIFMLRFQTTAENIRGLRLRVGHTGTLRPPEEKSHALHISTSIEAGIKTTLSM